MSMFPEIKFTEKQERALHKLLDFKYTLLYGGSRSGKTFVILFLIIWRALRKKSRHAILRFRFSHAKQSIWYDSLAKALSLLNIDFTENRSDWFIKFPNSSEIWIGGLDDKDRVDKILGNEYSTIFLNEISQISWDAYTTILTRLAEKSGLKLKLFLDENPPSKAHWSYKLFIEHKHPDTNMPLDAEDVELYAALKMNPIDNQENLPDDYIKMLEQLPLAKRNRFLKGLFADIMEGALWNEKIINQNRVPSAPDLFEKIIVSVDPAITANADSDETGIIVVGKGRDGRGYVLEDCSDIYRPAEWADMSIKLLKRYDADYIVAEKNQGGDMVKHTIKTSNKNAAVKLVHAAKGKILRAEPISLLYEDNMISHVGIFPDLENEMISFTGAAGDASPNRLDAMVHGFADLFPLRDDFEPFY